jgi:hypothetical protein
LALHGTFDPVFEKISLKNEGKIQLEKAYSFHACSTKCIIFCDKYLFLINFKNGKSGICYKKPPGFKKSDSKLI